MILISNHLLTLPEFEKVEDVVIRINMAHVKDMKQLKNICEHNYNLYLHNKHESKNKFYKKIYGTYNEPYTDPKFQH